MSSLNKSKLPAEYQEVEWLKGSGTQFCVTDYYPQYNSQEKTVLIGDFTILSKTMGKFGVGCQWTDDENTLFYHVEFHQNKLSFAYGTSTDYMQISTADYGSEPIDIHFELGATYLKVNNNTFTRTQTTFNKGTEPIYIGATVFRQLVLNQQVQYKKISIYNDTTLITEIIPCYRKSDNKPGFYQVNIPTGGTHFLENMGTGSNDWIIGPVV